MAGPSSLAAILTKAKAGRPAPAYLFYGDPFLVKDAAKKLIEALVPETDRALRVEVVDEETQGPAAIAQRLRTYPLLPGPKIVAVYETGVFITKQSPGDLVRRSVDLWTQGEHAEAAAVFLRLLGASGLTDEDLHGRRWETLSPEEWKRLWDVDVTPRLSQWAAAMGDHARTAGLRVGGSPGGLEALEQALAESQADRVVLLMTARTVDQRRRLFRLIAEKGVVLELGGGKRGGPGLSPERVRALALELAEAERKMLSPEALRAIEERAGHELGAFHQEMGKLLLYVGNRARVEAPDVEEVFHGVDATPIYELGEAIGQQDVRRALSLLRELLGRRFFPPQIIGSLHSTVQLLFLARAYLDGPAGEPWRPGMPFEAFQARVFVRPPGDREPGAPRNAFLALHPYRAYRLCQLAERLQSAQVAQWFRVLLEADLAVKSSVQDPHLALEQAIIRLCTPLERPRGKASAS